jgi:hypothetical protein
MSRQSGITLDIQRIALDYGMSLKDGGAYNIQFVDGKPTFESQSRLRERDRD